MDEDKEMEPEEEPPPWPPAAGAGAPAPAATVPVPAPGEMDVVAARGLPVALLCVVILLPLDFTGVAMLHASVNSSMRAARVGPLLLVEQCAPVPLHEEVAPPLHIAQP